MEPKKIIATALYGWNCREVRYDKVRVFDSDTRTGTIMAWAEKVKKKKDDKVLTVTIRYED